MTDLDDSIDEDNIWYWIVTYRVKTGDEIDMADPYSIEGPYRNPNYTYSAENMYDSSLLLNSTSNNYVKYLDIISAKAEIFDYYQR